MSFAELKGDVVILACAISAGIHGALAPAHFSDGAGAGTGFAASAVALIGLVVWLTARPASRLALLTTGALLLGLLASYALALSSGLPVLHPEPEPVDGLALTTKAIEAIGLVFAARILWRPDAAFSPTPKGI